MTLWVLVQVLVNLVLLAGLGGLWIRFKRPPSEDPRLSRGLQVLQSKIAVLEDLSDRTDLQVRQLSALLEKRCMEIQGKILDAEKVIREIDLSRQKSLETAKIFEDKIPHQEIVDRQNTVKYVKAARLAHQGVPIEQILQQVDLSTAEVEFIAKVNRDQLMFSEENLPQWIQEQIHENPVPAVPEPIKLESAENLSELQRLGEEFQKAVNIAEQTKTLSQKSESSYQMTNQSFVEIQISPPETAKTTSGKTVEIKPFEFPRIRI